MKLDVTSGMHIPRLWMLPIIIFALVNYSQLFSSAPVAAATESNLNIHQRPRFQIPHGNLSYYRNPQWEVLYYLKFGVFPFYSSSSTFLNRTQYLDKIRLIKSKMDVETLAAALAKLGVDLGDKNVSEGGDELPPHPGGHRELHLPPLLSPQEASRIYQQFYYPLAHINKNNAPIMKLKREHENPINIVSHFLQSLQNKPLGSGGVPLATASRKHQIGIKSFTSGARPLRYEQNHRRVAKDTQRSQRRPIFGPLVEVEGEKVLSASGEEPERVTAGNLALGWTRGREFHTQGWKKR